MRAALINSFEGLEKVVIEEMQTPQPQGDEVQIAIKYAGVNPVDWKIAEGHLKTQMEYEFPIILGWDAAGEISKVGAGVKNFKVGDPVFAYCRQEKIQKGSYAEYICLKAANVAHKPKKVSFAQAAAIPLSALTAWQALYDTGHLKSQERVLIHAGAGGVGGYAIQLAKLVNAYVITTCGAANFDYVKSLGADELIDYTEISFAEALKEKYPDGLDFVFDTVGGETLKTSYQLVKKGGRLITIAGVIDHSLAAKQNLFAEFVFVRPDGKELSQIAALYDDSKLRPPPIQEVPLTDIVSALRKSREGHTKGKIVLKI